MKKRVAFCLRDMQLGGVESVLIRTLEYLSTDKKFDITVVTFVDVTEPGWVDWFDKHKNVKRVVLYPSRVLGTRMPRFFLWRVVKHFARDVYRFCRRVRVVKKLLSGFDVFIDYHDFGFSHELKNIKNAKKIAWFHSSISVFQKRKFSRKLCIYDNVVVLTDDCANDMKNLCPAYANKFIRIYNPIDIESVRARAHEKCNVRGKYFCSVARMSYDKDIWTLLDAFDLFWKTHRSVKLVLVGGGDKRDVFEKYADGLMSHKNIIFTGAQKNPYPYVAGAVAHILSSRGEGLPTVLIEAAVLGVLNIASNCKYGPREILLDGAAGVLFAPGDTHALAKAMTDVYENTLDVQKMINASTRGLKRFAPDVVIKQIKSLIS